MAPIASLTVSTLALFARQTSSAPQGPGKVSLGAASGFAVLAASGVSTVPFSNITGDVGVSPISSGGLTGFNLSYVANASYATSNQVNGLLYASNYGNPTPAYLTAAINDMKTAYTYANGLAPNVTELGAGNIGGLTLTPGVYTWSSDVDIPSQMYFSGGSNDTFVLSVAGKITMASDIEVTLIGGAVASNIFWTAGDTVSIGSGSIFEGVVIAKTNVVFKTGAAINGQILSGTEVALQMATVNSA